MKLQRNALSVLEHPTGNEVDNDLEVEHTQWNNPSDMSKFGSLSLSINGPKLSNICGMLRLFFHCVFAATEDTLKPHKSKQRGHRSSRLSQKAMCRALSCDSHSKNSSITPRGNMVMPWISSTWWGFSF